MRRVGAGLENAGPLLAWSLGAAILTLSSIAAILASTSAASELPWKSLIIGVVLAVPGVLIAAGRPRIPVGWLILASALVFAVAGVSNGWVVYALDAGINAGVDWAAWFTDRMSAVLVPLIFLALILLPDGRLPSKRWKPVVSVVVTLQCGTVLAWALVDGNAAAGESDLPPAARQLENPLGYLPEVAEDVLSVVEPFVLQLPLLLCVIAFALRLWKARGDERTRVASILLGATVFVLLLVIGRGLWPQAAEVLDIVAGIFLAAVVTTAVLQRRLVGVDVIVHHAVLFTVLTVAIAGAYALAVTVAALSSQDLSPFGIGVIAALVAFAALPFRGWLQLLVYRLLYGDRKEPYKALRRLVERTHDARTLTELLNELASTIATSLRVPWACVEVNGVSATTGTRPVGTFEIQAPLLSQGKQIGTIAAAAGTGRTLRRQDEALLAALGQHGGTAVRAMILAEAVIASRHRVVVSREEERRALSRDLHDELGPTLASLSMQLGTIRRIVSTDPHTAELKLGELEMTTQDALTSVRALAKNLRPPVLDELGLETAIRRAAESLSLELRMPTLGLPPLSAAIEVAAYRIAVEALTNVARHAGTRDVEVLVSVKPRFLELQVTDAGRGRVDAVEPGVGTIGMRERAEELGGTLMLESHERGTIVTATFPLHAAEAELLP